MGESDTKSKHGASPKAHGLILILILASLVTLQQTTTIGTESRLGIALNNAAHAPWFFLITCLVWQFSGLFSLLNGRLRLLWVIVFAVFLAAFLEALQVFNQRDADIKDIGLNLLGACSAIAVLVAIQSLRQGMPRKSGALLILASLSMFASFTPVAELLWANYQRDALAPALISFSPGYPTHLLIRGDWELIPTSNNPKNSESPHIAKVILSSQKQWPGLILREPFPDWNGYQWLNINAYSSEEQTIQLEIRLETFSDRGMDSIFTIDLPHAPGTIRIPLHQLAGHRFGNLDKVKSLYLIKSQPGKDESFFLTSIYLD